MADKILFRTDVPNVYKYDDIYDPPNQTTPGNIVPAIKSLIVKLEDGTSVETLWVVSGHYTDPIYGENILSTLKPINMANNIPYDMQNQYRENQLYLYMMPPDAGNTTLIIDRQLVLAGTLSTHYELLQIVNQTDTVISIYDDPATQSQVPEVPLLDTAYGSLKEFENCYTDTVLTEDSTIVLRLLQKTTDTNGDPIFITTGEINLITKNAIITEPSAGLVILTDLDVTVNQTDGSPEYLGYLYQSQAASDLEFTLKVTDNEGAITDIPADVSHPQAKIHGLSSLDTAVPGGIFTLLAKYYASSTQAISYSASDFNTKHVLAKAIKIKILENTPFDIRYIGLVPYSSSNGPYNLEVIIINNDDTLENVTAHVQWMGAGYLNNTFNSEQVLQANITLTRNDVTMTLTSYFNLTLLNTPSAYSPGTIPLAGYTVQYDPQNAVGGGTAIYGNQLLPGQIFPYLRVDTINNTGDVVQYEDSVLIFPNEYTFLYNVYDKAIPLRTCASLQLSGPVASVQIVHPVTLTPISNQVGINTLISTPDVFTLDPAQDWPSLSHAALVCYDAAGKPITVSPLALIQPS